MMKALLASAAALCLAASAHAQVSDETIRALGAPDSVETAIGTLTFKDGVPDADTAAKVYGAVDFANALAVYNNSFRGASAYALRKAFEEVAGPNGVVIFSELMDAASLFLTANADTVYYLSAIDLSHGPIVVEQPSDAVGTINDMWFSWVIDIGGPGPDRGLGGKYLIVPPGLRRAAARGRLLRRAFEDRPRPLRRPRLPRGQRPEARGREREGEPEDLSLRPGRLRHQHRPGADRRRAAGGRAEDPGDEVRRGHRPRHQHHPPERRRLLRHDQRERAGRAGDQLRRRARRPARGDRHRARARRSRRTSG